MSVLLRVAFFSMILFAMPRGASAQDLICRIVPSLCQTSGSGGTGVPELDGNSAGTAAALVLGAALLLSTRRRRSA
jgi:hypothetical protein